METLSSNGDASVNKTGSFGKAPRLPKYDGSKDPELWLKQLEVAFFAHQIATDAKGAWIILALLTDNAILVC